MGATANENRVGRRPAAVACVLEGLTKCLLRQVGSLSPGFGVTALLVCGALLLPTVAVGTPRLEVRYATSAGVLYAQDGQSLSVSKRGSDYAGRALYWSPNGRFALCLSGRNDLAGGATGLDYPRVVDSWIGTSRNVTGANGQLFTDRGVEFGGFSKDGRSFAIVHHPEDGSTDRIYICDSLTGLTLESTSARPESRAAISPSGDRVAYIYGQQIRMFNPSANSDAPWVNLSDFDPDYAGTLRWPCDGPELLLDGSAGSARSQRIRAINLSDKSERIVPSNNGAIIDVSRDGRWILTDSLWPKVSYVASAIARIDTHGGATTWLLSPSQISSVGGSLDCGSVSDDGRYAVFGFLGWYSGTTDRIVTVRYDGAERRTIATGVNPSWHQDTFLPTPYGWSVRNGSDTDRSDDWAVWKQVFGAGPISWMRYSARDWSAGGLFAHGNCQGFAGSALVDFARGGPGVKTTLKRSPGFGVWSAVSTSPKDSSGWPRLISTTEPAIRERVEAFQLIQSSYGNVPRRAGARSAASEVIRRLDNGQPPIVIGIHAKGSGHALVPFRYERVGGQIRLYVYDSNWPGDSGRYIDVNASTGVWDYTLSPKPDKYWTAGDSAISWSSYEDVSAAAGGITGLSNVESVEAASPSAVSVLSGTNAHLLATDGAARRTGYAAGTFVNEIPGALPEYPDALNSNGVVSSIRFGSTLPLSVAATPIQPGPWGFGLSDADSIVEIACSSGSGEVDTVKVNASVDSVALSPSSGVRTVSMWVGTWAGGGRVKYGVVDAMTTAGDLVVAASSSQGRVQNLGSGSKRVVLAAMGDGWIGRKSSPVLVPGGATVTFRVSDPAAVGASQMQVATNGGAWAVVGSSTYGVSRAVLKAVPPVVSFNAAFTVRAQTAESSLPASQARLEVSYDGGKKWSSLGSFSSRDSGGFLVKSTKLSRNARLRVRVLSSAMRSGGASPSHPISVRSWVSSPVAPKTMRNSKSYIVYGSLKPKHAEGTKPVRIYKYEKVGKKWVKKGYVKATAYNYRSDTRFKVKMKLTSKGKWRLRAYAPADSKHAATWSKKYDYVTVK